MSGFARIVSVASSATFADVQNDAIGIDEKHLQLGSDFRNDCRRLAGDPELGESSGFNALLGILYHVYNSLSSVKHEAQ